MSALQNEIVTGRLATADLIEVTQNVARDVREGVYEVHADAEQRWHVRLHSDDQVDIWLISWTTDQGTQLHDHGGSAGAFTVVTGTLAESVWSPLADGMQQSNREAGDTVAFGEQYVHDVGNQRAGTAVSVHAYSPPLSLMNYYDAEDGGLVRLASVWTDDPEEPLPTPGAFS